MVTGSLSALWKKAAHSWRATCDVTEIQLGEAEEVLDMLSARLTARSCRLSYEDGATLAYALHRYHTRWAHLRASDRSLVERATSPESVVSGGG